MDVILKEDMRAVGQAGEVVKVSPGFGRNYLLPLKKAVPATPANLRSLEQERHSIQAKRAKEKAAAEDLAQKIQASAIIMERTAGEEDKLFGSITTRQIAEALAAQGVTVDHRNLHLKEPIKKVGIATVEIHLHSEVTATLTVEVRKI